MEPDFSSTKTIQMIYHMRYIVIKTKNDYVNDSGSSDDSDDGVAVAAAVKINFILCRFYIWTKQH